MIEVNRAIVVGLGRDGSLAAEQLAGRIKARLDGDIPIVQTITINFGQPDVVLPNDEYTTHLALHRQQAGGSSQDGRATQAAPSPTSTPRWLPDDISNLEDDDRAMGRLLLYENAIDISYHIERAVDRISRLENQLLLEQRNLKESNPNQIHCFVVANLSDPLASGMLLDFTYMARALITRPMGPEFSLQTWCMAMLAGIPNRTEEAPSDARTEARQRLLANARTYATLKEIDYYMDRANENSYVAVYPATVGTQTITDAGQAPFDYVYLISKDNIAHLSLSDTGDAATMMAEWIYQVVCTTVEEKLVSRVGMLQYFDGKVGAYSSTGLSYYYLPSGQLHTYASNRLALQLVTERLLNTPPANHDMDVSSEFRSTSQMELDALAIELQRLDGLDPTTRGAIAKYTQKFDLETGILPYESEFTEKEIINQYNNRLTYTLGRVEEQIGKMLRIRQRALVDNLRVERDRQLDKDDDGSGGSPLRAKAFFNHLLSSVRQNLDKATRELKQKESSLRSLNGSVRESRKLYRLGANSFGVIPLVKETPPTIFLWHARWTILFVLLLIGIAYYSWAFMASTLNHPIQGSLLAVGVLFIGAVGVFQTFRWLLGSRSNLAERHYTRLQTLREVLLLQHAIEYYEFAIKQVSEVLKQVEEFIETLESTQKSFQRSAGPEVEKHLLVNEDESFAEVVLTKQDVDMLYKAHVERTDLMTRSLGAAAIGRGDASGARNAGAESVLPVSIDLRQAWTALKDRHGPISSWRDPEGKKEPSDILTRFSRAFMSDITSHSVDELLSKRTDSQLNDGLKRMFDLSAPFWQVDKISLNSQPAEPISIVSVASVRANSPLIERIRQRGDTRSIQLISNQNDKYVVFTSDHSGLPLFAVTPVINMRDHYVQMFNHGRIAQLHTTRDSIVFPDLRPTSDNAVEVPERYSGTPFNAQMVAALGIALEVIAPAQGVYQFQYMDEDDIALGRQRQRTVELGVSKGEVCARLHENIKYLNILRDRVDAALNARSGLQGRAEPSIPQLQTVGLFVQEYLEGRAPELEEWEELRLRTFTKGLLERLKGLQAMQADMLVQSDQFASPVDSAPSRIS